MHRRSTPPLQKHLIEHLEPRQLLAFSASINFQPAGSAVPAGYAADTGAIYASRGNGLTYGWNQSAVGFARDRNNPVSPDQRYDTFVHTQLYGNRTWEIAVPNGTYQVHLVAGDSDYYNSTLAFNAEGVTIVSGTPSKSNRWLEGTKTVTVTDGKLTISNGAGAVNNKLDFIDITSTGGTTLPTVSIAATDASASESGNATGTFKITRTGSTAASLLVNFAVAGSATNGSDYNAIPTTVTIPAGASSANVVITPIDDSLVEGSESVILTLASSSSYTLGTQAATVTIADNDSPGSNGQWPTQWTTGPANTRTRWESAAVTMDGKIWNFGGWFSSSINGTHDYAVYDPAKNTWTDLGQDPIPVTHAAAVEDPANHVIYLLGGEDGDYPGVPSNKVWKYNTLNNTWSSMLPMPQVHAAGGAVLINNQLHYFGGVEQNHDVDVADHIYLDLGNLAAGWRTAPPMPIALDHFSTAVVNNKVYAIGGEFGHDKQHIQHTDVQIYDPATQTWSFGADAPLARSHTEAATFVTPDNKIIVAGGQTANFGVTDLVAEYDPAKNTWAAIGALPRAMEGPVVQQIGDMLIVSTGNPGGGPINSTWIGMLS